MVVLGNAHKSVFGFESIPHFFASALGDLQKACSFAERVGTVVGENADTIEAITSLVPGVGSQAVLLERAAFSALGLVVAAVHASSGAASADGLSLSLDEATVAAFKQLISGCEADLERLGYKV